MCGGAENAKINTMKYVVALGANLGDRQATLTNAVSAIAEQIGSVLAQSRLIETEPLIHPDDSQPTQPSYLNGALLVKSSLSPAVVLEKLLAIEQSLGRVRSLSAQRWQPRHIDLDLIVADDLVLSSPTLVIPHPEMHKRRFVLEPMCEVWRDWRHPLLGKSTAELLDGL